MKNLLSAWPQLSRQATGKHLLLLLDYDGTLTPIMDKPQQAILSAQIREQLRKLSKNPDITLGIVSGRDFDDLRRRVGLGGLIYASNHGFKIRGNGIDFEAPISRAVRKALADFQTELAGKIQGIPGALLERKKFSFALHYRLVRTKDLPAIKIIFNDLLKRCKQCGLEVKTGKKVLEVMPAMDWNKGKAALHILNTLKAMHGRHVVPIYIGDDITDEDAFRAFAKKGIAARVGKSKNSFAQYYLDSPTEVHRFVASLARF